MKTIHAQAEHIQSEIRLRFGELNKLGRPSKQRRYPNELKQLVCRAHSQGVQVKTLSQLSGLSSTRIKLWLEKAATIAKPPRVRRLAVVEAIVTPEVKANTALESLPLSPAGGARRGLAKTLAPVVIRLPSGVVIELGESCALNAALLASLSALGGGHASSC